MVPSAFTTWVVVLPLASLPDQLLPTRSDEICCGVIAVPCSTGVAQPNSAASTTINPARIVPVVRFIVCLPAPLCIAARDLRSWQEPSNRSLRPAILPGLPSCPACHLAE